jgi:hypothetical protein
MAILLDIAITTGQGTSERIGMVEIRRLEPLGDGDDHRMETHPYVADSYMFIDDNTDVDHQTASLNHRYGDGVFTLISNAMAALGYPESEVR